MADPIAELLKSFSSPQNVDTSKLTGAQRAIFAAGDRRLSNQLLSGDTSIMGAIGTPDFSLDAQGAKKALTNYFVRNPQDKSVDALLPTAAKARDIQQQLVEQSQAYKINWKNKAGNAGTNTATFALQLANKGVTDINTLKGGAGGKIVDTKTGQEISFKKAKGSSSAFASARGEGWTNFRVAQDANGKPVFYQQWADSSDKAKIMPLVSLGLGLLAPGLGSAVGASLGLGGTAASVAGNAVTSAVFSAAGGARGPDIFKSALSGGIGSYIGSFAPAISKAAGGGTFGNIVAGGTTGVAKSALTGGDPIRALLLGSLNGVNVGQKLGLQGTQANAFNKLALEYAKYRLPRKP